MYTYNTPCIAYQYADVNIISISMEEIVTLCGNSLLLMVTRKRPGGEYINYPAVQCLFKPSM